LKTCEDLGEAGALPIEPGSSLFHFIEKQLINFGRWRDIRGHFEKARREGESMPGFFYCLFADCRLPI
jgi:hypothetical protein